MTQLWDVKVDESIFWASCNKKAPPVFLTGAPVSTGRGSFILTPYAINGYYTRRQP